MNEKQAWEHIKEIYQEMVDSGTRNTEVAGVCSVILDLRDNKEISFEISQEMGNKVAIYMEDYSGHYLAPLTVSGAKVRVRFCNLMISEL